MSGNICARAINRIRAISALQYGGIQSVLRTRQQTMSSSASGREAEKIYELRCYSLQPRDMREFMDLSTKWMHLRLGHSKLIGYWLSEIGGLNEVVHVWEYDSLNHRAAVRKALAGDPEWVGNYFSKLLPMLVKQDNSLVKLVPGTCVSQPPDKGIYEIQHFDYAPQKGNELSSAVQNLSRSGGTLLGSFYTVIGQKSTGCQLWWHPDVDSVYGSELSADADTGIRLGQSKMLLPVPWSPMQ